MKAVIHQQKSLAIVYDASRLDCPGVDYFSVDYWKSRQAVLAEAVGRGSAWFIDTPSGPVVLRHYLRGGWAAKLSRNGYLFTKVSRSRPFREFHLLASLFEQGLPVPRPVAAACEHHGFFSSGVLMTTLIPSAQTLADVIDANPDGYDHMGVVWENVGRCIRRFHDAGVWHADLNARNILLDDEQQIFLIDFDRARYTAGKPVPGQGNLRRLKRSLLKFWPTTEFPNLQVAWNRLEAGYYE